MSRNKHEELLQQLHQLADWVEKCNNVHCPSVPRKAAYTIEAIEEENHILRLSLNKKYLSLRDIYDRYVGDVRVFIYKLQQRRKRVKR
jgi:hypothetical protein